MKKLIRKIKVWLLKRRAGRDFDNAVKECVETYNKTGEDTFMTLSKFDIRKFVIFDKFPRTYGRRKRLKLMQNCLFYVYNGNPMGAYLLAERREWYIYMAVKSALE